MADRLGVSSEIVVLGRAESDAQRAKESDREGAAPRPNCRRRAPREKHSSGPRRTASSRGRMARPRKPRSLASERARRRARANVGAARRARDGATAGFAVPRRRADAGHRPGGEARLPQGGGGRQSPRSFCAGGSARGPRRNESGWRKSNRSRSRAASATSCGGFPAMRGMNADFSSMDWRPAWATSRTAARGWKKSAG
jgi:hypothetical protein